MSGKGEALAWLISSGVLVFFLVQLLGKRPGSPEGRSRNFRSQPHDDGASFFVISEANHIVNPEIFR